MELNYFSVTYPRAFPADTELAYGEAKPTEELTTCRTHSLQ
jgi:hypothetical protein